MESADKKFSERTESSKKSFDNSSSRGRGVPASHEFSESISFDLESSNGWTFPKSEFPEFIHRKTCKEIKSLLREKDISKLKSFLEKNLQSLNYGTFLRDELLNLCKKFASPDTSFNKDMDAITLMDILRDILEGYQRKFALFDVSLESAGILEGSALSAKIDKSMKKVSELLEFWQIKLNEAEEKIWHLEQLNEEYLTLIGSFQSQIAELSNRYLNSGQKEMAKVDSDANKFFNEIKEHLEKTIHLNSTFKEELENEKRKNHSLLQEIAKLKEQAVNSEQEKQKEIAELAADLELDEGIRKSITEKIKTLTPKNKEVQNAVNCWMKEVHSHVEQNKDKIANLKDTVKSLENEIARRTLDYEELKGKQKRLKDSVTCLDCELNEKLQEYHFKENKLKNINTEIETMKCNISDRYLSSPESPATFYAGKSPSSFRRRTPDSFTSTPEKFRQGSPEYTPKWVHELSPISIQSSPQYHSTSQSITPPSPYHINERSFQGASINEDFFVPSAPGTQPLPHPLPRLAPRTVTVGSSKRSASAKSIIDVGKSFNMRTIHDNTSTPYRQVTRVNSTIPYSGSSRMVESPFSIQHSAILTPTQYVTPFISKSRFGYTDPHAKVLNIPPGDDLDIPSAYKRTISPAVSAIHGPDSETQVSAENAISPVYTFGTPPAVTPTTTRRHGLFTPTGIFRKRHYNIRHLFSPTQYISPDLPWSPTYLPYDSRSPITSLSPFPYYSDKSISWEKGRDNLLSLDEMNRTFDAHPAMNITFEADPGMNKTFYTSSPAVNRSFVISPTAANRTFDAHPAMNRTYDAQPGMNTTFCTSPLAANRTFEISPSAANRTYDAQPIMNRTYDAQPGMNTTLCTSPLAANRTFEISPSAANRTYDEQPIMNRTYDTQPGMNATFCTSPLAANRTFEISPSAANRTYDAQPIMNRTYDTQPGMNATFCTSPLAANRTYEMSPSAANRTYDAQLIMNRTYDTQPGMNATFCTSPLAANRTFEMSPSAANRTYDAQPVMNRNYGTQPGLNTTFYTSPLAANKTYEMSPSTTNKTYDATPPDYRGQSFQASSFVLNRTFEESSPRREENNAEVSLSPIGKSYVGNQSYELHGSFDTDFSPSMDNRYEKHSSPILNKTYDKNFLSPLGRACDTSIQPELNRTFDRSSPTSKTQTFEDRKSPVINKTFDKTFY